MYSILAYGFGTRSDLLISAIGNTLAIPAAIYVYFGVATLAYRGRFLLLALTGAVSIFIGAALMSGDFLWTIGSQWGMLLLGGGLIGWLAVGQRGAFYAYLYGLGAVVTIATIWLIPQISNIQESMLAFGKDAVEAFKITGIGADGEKPTEITIQNFEMIVGWFSRLAPGTLVISLLTQYSAGALLFLTLLDRVKPEKKRLVPFIRWQMPFWVLAFLPVSVATRFLVGGMPGLIADNLLLILSVFYCVTGISLLDYYMRKISLSILAKIVVYILFLPLGLVGYMGLCLCGVLDSFFDWRGINQPDEQLEKSVI